MADSDLTRFPDRLACFGNSSFEGHASCTTTTPAMIDFLNLTDFHSYKQAYCLNAPTDSCAFGYCGNPDIASPGFRVASYVCSIFLSIVILYAHEEDVKAAFYAQMLTTYSLIFAAIIAIAEHNLTRLHAVFVLQMAGSPLSFYLVVTIVKSIMSKKKGNPAAWRRKPLNRVLVLALVPLWAAVLIFVALPSHIWQFQQAACDFLLDHHVVAAIMLVPAAMFFVDRASAIFNSSLLGALVLTWAVGIYLQRGAARKMMVETGRGRIMATWHSFVDAYPFIQLITVVIYPSLYWIITLEAVAVFVHEQFQPTYGQLLAIFVAVPPVLQTLPLIPKIGPWFINLTWVRFLTCRRRKSRNGPPSSAYGEYLALDDRKGFVPDVKPDFNMTYPTTDNIELQGLVPTLPSSRRYPP